MAYKILYIEDQNADSIKADLISFGFEVDVNNADDFEGVIDQFVNEYDAFIIDYRLTDNRGRFDAPSYAQTLRTKTKKIVHKDAPIILISNEVNFVEIFNDFTSKDLFDFTVTKESFRKELVKYAKKINAYINAYNEISRVQFELEKILSIDKSTTLEAKLDYRFIDIITNDRFNGNVYKYCLLIVDSLLSTIGPLIGEDILSSRLGVSKDSKDWTKLLEKLDQFKYKGILSDYYDRWWMEDILNWWSEISEGKSLRRLTSVERTNFLKMYLTLDLLPNHPIEFCNSSNFWSICMETKMPIDPSEGYIIQRKELKPWQEPEYISLTAALNQSELRKYLSPINKAEIRKFEKDGAL